MSQLLTPPGNMKFPSNDSLMRAQWRSIFIEPMLGSGERICIGVAVANSTAYEVAQVPALTRLRCIYGDAVQAILTASEFVLQDLRVAFVKTGASTLHSWVAPMSGIHLGDIRQGAGADMNEIIRNALVMSASLVEQLAESDEEDESAGGFTTPRLEHLIKEAVINVKPQLRERFSVKLKRAANQRPVTMGFLGSNLAANFGVIFPMNLSANVRDIKSKLWDLANLREEPGRKSLFPSTVHRYEMHVYRPRPDEPVFSDRQLKSIEEAANELETEADDMEVICRTTPDHSSIARRILEAEAA